MALLEYNIQYDDKTEASKVTCRILSVGGPGPDKIRFKSNDPNTGIQYVGGSPFDPRDSNAPQPDKVFRVGKKTKEFEVVKSVTRDERLRFKCGEVVPAPVKMTLGTTVGGKSAPTNDARLKLNSWKGGGGGTPPPDI
jgi:hypothetical protein